MIIQDFKTRTGISSQKESAFEILSAFPNISPFLVAQDGEIYTRVSNEQAQQRTYGSSFAYIAQATRNAPLKFFDGKNLITFTFDKYGQDVVAVSPLGPKTPEILQSIGELLYAAGLSLCVKKIYGDSKDAFIGRGFDIMPFSSNEVFNKDKPDDIMPERYIEVTDCKLENRANERILQKTRAWYGSALTAIAFPELQLLSALHDCHAKLDPNIATTVKWSMFYASCADEALKTELSQFVFEWAERKAKSGTIRGIETSSDPVNDYTSPYTVLVSNLEHFPNALLTLARDRETDKILACALTDSSAPNTRSVVMNLSDTQTRHMGTILLAMVKVGCPAYDPTTHWINFGGSEEVSLDSFKKQFAPSYTVEAAYLKYHNGS